MVQDIKRNGWQFYMANANTDARPYLPLEFAGAAYRYGHSQIEERYRVNDNYEADLFQGTSGNTLRGFRPVPGDEAIDWSYFFDVDGLEYVPRPDLPPIQPPQIPDPIEVPDGLGGVLDGDDDSDSGGGMMPDGGNGGDGTLLSSGGVFGPDVQKVAPIDTKLPESLMQLPFITGNEPKSLASRNLIRGRQIKLPPGRRSPGRWVCRCCLARNSASIRTPRRSRTSTTSRAVTRRRRCGTTCSPRPTN